MGALSVDQLRDVGRDLDQSGYALVRGVVTKSRLAAFSHEITEAYQRSAKFSGGGTISGHLNCSPGEASRFIYRELEAHGVVDAVRTACPDRPQTIRPTLNFNLPGSSAQHYHMDGVYTREYIICNVAVVDTDLVNGAIDVLPTTHLEFYPFWRYAVQRKYRLSTRLPMRQGDVLLRRSTLWHRGMPNRSQQPRPMFSMTLGEQEVPVEDPFSTHGGEIAFYANWYTTGRFGALRDASRWRSP